MGLVAAPGTCWVWSAPEREEVPSPSAASPREPRPVCAQILMRGEQPLCAPQDSPWEGGLGALPPRGDLGCRLPSSGAFDAQREGRR